MPKNTLLFPPSFVFDTIGAESGISGLQIAVNNLAVASKSGAMRQAHALGVGGRNSIKNQNKGMPTLNSLLPTRSVGKYTVASSIPTGTLGYFLSGWVDASDPNSALVATRVERFTFATNTITNLGSLLTANMHGGGAIANPSYGYIAQFTYLWRMTFQSESISLLGQRLSFSRYMISNLKNKSRGYFCLGWSSFDGTIYDIDRFSFSGEVCAGIGTVIQGRAWATGFGNNFNGYLCGGSLNGSIATMLANNIERFSYASESKVDISAILSSARNKGSSWTPGTSFASYLVGGDCNNRFPDPVNSAVRKFSSNKIDKFTFAGETVALLGVTLPNGRTLFESIGSPARSVLAGGTTHTDSYSTQNAYALTTQITDLTFATEVATILGATLSIARYYTVSLDNSSF
ncbi:hypothetical protein QT972_27175 [Microcoleus sp. herbarium7]|uniref:hypothetical protein n=1 Tax=Microcoleus sp. herbarium7 TaxID=3055435 RepID=UPI002FD26C1F